MPYQMIFTYIKVVLLRGNFVKWLKYFREKRGYSQRALVGKVGVQENTLWRWENKKSTPSVGIAERIANILSVETSELLNGPTEEAREFTLIYDREGDLRMEVLNMAANAPEQRVMSVLPQRIAAMVNIKTANLNREEAKKMMLDEMAARFDEAWAQQEKWKEAGA